MVNKDKRSWVLPTLYYAVALWVRLFWVELGHIWKQPDDNLGNSLSALRGKETENNIAFVCAVRSWCFQTKACFINIDNWKDGGGTKNAVFVQNWLVPQLSVTMTAVLVGSHANHINTWAVQGRNMPHICWIFNLNMKLWNFSIHIACSQYSFTLPDGV